MNLHPSLDDDAHQPAAVVIDDLLHGILQFFLALADHCHFILHAIHHQFFDGFAKIFVLQMPPSLSLASLIADQVFCLLLASR